ncbi:ribosome maturation factor RimP [Desulfovibrio oxyclinae]|uniref:ribosome maturation factor RimP n=1 Tax=Desulfovibrio oxyclinae TaxID=63560 RepID=UPI000363E0C1|nr:ribosome maturation factor RimP [Desulfovibrio oxyclinae]
MTRKRFEDILDELVRPEVEGLGYTLWGISCPGGGGKRRILIYIDGPDGVTVDACAEVSRQVGLVLEMEDAVPGAFTLEVSSPGLEREFFSIDQMAAYTGKTVRVTLWEPRQEQRKFSGTLAGIDENAFVLETETGNESFSWGEVKKARLVHVF